jgi:serine/threonine protein kinase
MVAQAERGLVVGSRYRLDSVLGEGGMAVVWRATHTETDRAVALKLVRRELVQETQVREMFVREARIAARIGQNAHIVDVLDAGVDPALEVPFIAMELLQGEPLDARIRREGPVPHALAADLVEQLGEALDQAHGAGVFHRDLKPQNLFLARDKKGRTTLKVVDFGIAKLAESVAASSTHVGTPAYAAPEQLGPSWRTIAEGRGKIIAQVVSAATDVWAMGLVVYEMLIGSSSGSLWGASTLAELPVKIVLEPPPIASTRAGDRAHLLGPLLKPTQAPVHAASFPMAAPPPNPPGPNVHAGPAMPAYTPQPVPFAQTPAPAHTPHTPHQSGRPVDPQLAAWAQHRRAELHAQADARLYLACNPFQLMPPVTHAYRDAVLTLRDARLLVAEVSLGDSLRQAMGEDRTVLAALSSPRIVYRAAIRSKQSQGLADGMARAFEGFWGTPARASLGDPHFENRYDLSFPSVQEGNMALPFPLRQLLMHNGFQGMLELRHGGLVMTLNDVVRFEAMALDRLLDAVAHVYGVIAP